MRTQLVPVALLAPSSNALVANSELTGLYFGGGFGRATVDTFCPGMWSGSERLSLGVKKDFDFICTQRL